MEGMIIMANKQGYKNLKNQVKFGINDAPPEAVNHALKSIMHWQRREIPATDEEFAERLNEFFQRCCENNEIPTVEKMAIALGTYRQHLWEWEVQETKGRLVSDMIKRAKAMISAMDAELAMTGKIQPVVYIFRAKNYYGMKDQVDFSTSENGQGGAFFDQKALELRYRNNTENVLDAGTIENQLSLNGIQEKPAADTMPAADMETGKK